ncbi:MAG: thioredoxin fold domain-containing protein [Campylobacteraceae bacterium]|jgi:thiol:disulfide interchange protein DsbC|nr:thioredoxin fold domain-containing protein [Campylobacteraceae bacterium]
MRKILIFSVIFLGFLQAISNEQIVNHFKSQEGLRDFNITIKNRGKVPDYPDFEFALIEISQPYEKENHNNHNSQKLNILIKGDFIFPEAVDVKNNVSLRQKIDDELLFDDLAKVYKNETKNNIISLGDNKKPALIILSDPECPYCRQELANIENRLKTNSVKIILTSFRELSALEKSALIYEETAKAKTDKQKIDVLKKYYDENALITQKVSENKIKNMDELRQKYLRLGLESTPLIIEEEKLLNR